MRHVLLPLSAPNKQATPLHCIITYIIIFDIVCTACNGKGGRQAVHIVQPRSRPGLIEVIQVINGRIVTVVSCIDGKGTLKDQGRKE
jgi:hypothetical protein